MTKVSTGSQARVSRKSPVGRFVVLAGIDGSGTTTQVAALSRALQARGVVHVTTFEPSTGLLGALLRQALAGRLVANREGKSAPLDARAMALLFAADRADHVDQQIRPALERGELVLCDRYLLSSLAYQGLALDATYVEAINEGSPSPDLPLFLAVPPTLAQERRAKRGGQDELYDALALQKRIDRLYRAAIARRKRRERIVTIDGTLPAAEVTQQLLGHLEALLPKRAR